MEVPPCNLQHLKDLLLMAWYQITQYTFRSLVEFMPQWIMAYQCICQRVEMPCGSRSVYKEVSSIAVQLAVTIPPQTFVPAKGLRQLQGRLGTQKEMCHLTSCH